jgi:hypothetical protein
MMNQAVSDALQVRSYSRIVDHVVLALNLFGHHFAEIHFLLSVEHIRSRLYRRNGSKRTCLLSHDGRRDENRRR